MVNQVTSETRLIVQTNLNHPESPLLHMIENHSTIDFILISHIIKEAEKYYNIVIFSKT